MTLPEKIKRRLGLVRHLTDKGQTLIERTGDCVLWLIPIMAVVINLVVFIRYGLGQGTVLLQESALYLHATAFMLGIAYTLKHDGHVRVDLLYAKWSEQRKALINLLGHLFFLIPTALLIGLGSLEYVANSWKVLEGSPEAGGIPAIFMLKTLIPATACLLLLQGLSGISESLKQLKKNKA